MFQPLDNIIQQQHHYMVPLTTIKKIPQMQKNMIQIELHHSGIKMVNTSQMRHHDLLLKYKVIKKDSEKKNLKIICSI